MVEFVTCDIQQCHVLSCAASFNNLRFGRMRLIRDNHMLNRSDSAILGIQ